MLCRHKYIKYIWLNTMCVNFIYYILIDVLTTLIEGVQVPPCVNEKFLGNELRTRFVVQALFSVPVPKHLCSSRDLGKLQNMQWKCALTLDMNPEWEESKGRRHKQGQWGQCLVMRRQELFNAWLGGLFMVAPFVDVLMQFIVPMLVGTLVMERWIFVTVLPCWSKHVCKSFGSLHTSRY